MNYTEAIAEVEAGNIAWRDAWGPTTYIQLNGSVIYLFGTTPPAGAYTATTADQNGTDWEHQDKPPRKP